MAREIKEGSWVHVKIPGRKSKFTTQVKRQNPDGSFDVTDPKTGNTRALSIDKLSPANKPKALR